MQCRVEELWYVHTTEHYSSIKEDEALSGLQREIRAVQLYKVKMPLNPASQLCENTTDLYASNGHDGNSYDIC